MDMDKEVEDFKKKNAPSLIGSSVRDSSDAIPTLKSLNTVKNPVYKSSGSTAALLLVDQVAAEGALINDEDSQLAVVLDNKGHIKDDVIPDSIKLMDQKSKSSLVTADELEKFASEDAFEDNSNKVTILGGEADKYLAPAGGSSSGYKYRLKAKKGARTLDDSNNGFIEPDHMRSVDDIINVVNKGDFEKASTLVLDKVSETIADGTKTLTLNDLKNNESTISEIPDSAIEVDSNHLPPAAMRDGSESRLLEEQKSRSTSNISRVTASRYDSHDRPNLARGDSIHSGLNGDLSISNSFDQLSKSLVSERKPRHDPGVPKVANASSLNYLRTISRSRSRMRSDRKSVSTDDHRLDSNELRESGALINDDEMSNAPDIEYAVNKALDFVEDTHNIKKGGKKLLNSGDIVKNLQKGLAEVEEENTGSNRTKVNTDDLLDQLADSAMELMVDSDLEEETDDKEEKVQKKKQITLSSETTLTDNKAENKDRERREEDEKKEEEKTDNDQTLMTRNELSIVPKVATATTALSLDNMMDQLAEEITGNDDEEEADEEDKDDKEDKKKEKVEKEEKEEKEYEEEEKEYEEEKEDEEKEKKLNEKKEKQKEQELPQFEDTKLEQKVEEERENKEHPKIETKKGKSAYELETEEAKKIDENEVIDEHEEDKHEIEKQEKAKEEEDAFEVIDKPSDEEVQEETSDCITEKDKEVEETSELLDEKKGEVSSFTEKAEMYYKEEIKEPITEENVANKVKEATSDKEEETQEEAVTLKAPSESKFVETEGDDIDGLIAAAAREKALKESHPPLGSDGSVFIPKTQKLNFEDEPVYLYTSLAGGFHVATRTNRLETILAANRIKFTYRDLGTDEEAKKVWRRYSNNKTLPGVVRGKDDYIGNWEDIEEANEDYRVRSLIYETY